MTHPTPSGFRAALAPLLLIATMLAVITCGYNAFSAVQEAAKAEMGLSDMQLGLLQGIGAAIPLAIVSIPAGLAIDRYSRRVILLLLGLFGAAGAWLIGMAESLELLFVGRMLTSLAANVAVTAAISIGADLVAPERRGASMLILTLGKWGGIAGSFAIGGWLFGWFSAGGAPGWLGGSAWRAVNVVLALASVAGALLLLFVREPERREMASAGALPVARVAAALWARRAFLIPLFLGQIAVFMADTAAAIWAAPVLGRAFGLQPQDFAGWMGLVIFGAGVGGSILGGLGADLGQRGGRRGGILIGAAICSGIAIPFALFPLAPSVPVFAAALFLFILCGTITGLITAATIAVLVPNELRGLCLGLFVAIGGVMAYGVAPPLVTIVSGMTGGESQLGFSLGLVGMAISLISFVSFLIAMRNAPRAAADQPI